MVTLVCQVCGKEFEARPSEARQGRKYCSMECYGQARGQSRRRRVVVNCEICGRPISLQPSEAEKGRKHCSYECAAEAKRRIPPEEHSCWKGGKKRRECKQCERVFYVHPWEIKDGRGIFCCHKCLNRWIVENRSGENHYNWQGGKSFEPYPPGWKRSLKERIREYEGRRCAICGKTDKGRALAVHHIDYDKSNLAEENLIALCHSCHIKTNRRRRYWEYWLSAGIVPEMMEMQYA